ncbi:MAG: hypothetical protein ACRDPZ_11455 [Gaiellaceae bacterium]
MRKPPQGEALAVWALVVLDVLAVLVTYSVVDPSELFSVTRDGLAGGFGRALVQLDFPHVAGAAIPITLLALDVLPRRAWLVGAPTIALCAVFAWPGVVDSDDLDPKPVNVLPAVGVVLAAALTVAAARRAGIGFAPRRSGDGLRIAVAVGVVLVSLPWITAEAGFHLPGGVFLTDEPYAEPGEGVTAAVHLGHHHGFMGALLVLLALLLSRPRLVDALLGHAYALLVSLMLAYGAANLVQDLWHEQVVKRGWTSSDIPSVTTPRLAAIWALVLAGTALAYALGFARRAEPAEPAIIT